MAQIDLVDLMDWADLFKRQLRKFLAEAVILSLAVSSAPSWAATDESESWLSEISQMDSQNKSSGPSAVGAYAGGEIDRGYFVMLELPVEDIRDALRGTELRLPSGHHGPTYPVMITFAAQRDVRLINPTEVNWSALSDSKVLNGFMSVSSQFWNARTNGWLRESIQLPLMREYRLTYSELATVIPGLEYRGQTVSYMPKVYLTSKAGERADRSKLGFNMDSRDVEIGQFEGDAIGVGQAGRLLFQLKLSKSLPDLDLNALQSLTAMQGEPIISSANGVVFFTGMIFGLPLSVRPLSGEMFLANHAIPGVGSVTRTVPVLEVSGLPWALLAGYRQYDDLLRSNIFRQYSPFPHILEQAEAHSYSQVQAEVARSRALPTIVDRAAGETLGRVAILGGSGAVGAGLVEYFALRGWQVEAVGRRSKLEPIVAQMFEKHADHVRYRQLDIYNPKTRAEALKLFKSVDVVINAAEPYPLSLHQLRQVREHTVYLYDVLAAAGYTAKNAGSKKSGGKKMFVRIGSPIERNEVNGGQGSDGHSDESSTPYFAAKYVIAQLTRDAVRSARLAAITLRPTQYLSPYSVHDEYEPAMLAFRTGVKSLPDVAIDTTTYLAVGRAIELALERAKIGSEYTLGGPTRGSAEVIQYILAFAGSPKGPNAISESSIDPRLKAQFIQALSRFVNEARLSADDRGDALPKTLEFAWLGVLLAEKMRHCSSDAAVRELGYVPPTLSEQDFVLKLMGEALRMRFHLPESNQPSTTANVGRPIEGGFLASLAKADSALSASDRGDGGAVGPKGSSSHRAEPGAAQSLSFLESLKAQPGCDEILGAEPKPPRGP